MTEEQARFYRDLFRPFGKDEIEQKNLGGKQLTYLKSQAGMNRLDEVCTPAGWDVSYTETDRGYTCTISICCPDLDDVWRWVSKSDGGGFEGMTKKAGGQSVEDTDNDEKSAYTNAFRRALMAWGFARELWKCGVPSWRKDMGETGTVKTSPALSSSPAPHAPSKAQPTQAPQDAPKSQAPWEGKPSPKSDARTDEPVRAANGSGTTPAAGKSLLDWVRDVRDRYSIDLTPKIKALIDTEGLPRKVLDWTPEHVARWQPELKAAAKSILAARGNDLNAQITAATGSPVNYQDSNGKDVRETEAPSDPFVEAPAAVEPAGAKPCLHNEIGRARELASNVTRSLWPVKMKMNKRTGVCKEDPTSFAEYYKKTIEILKIMLPADRREFRMIDLIEDKLQIDAIICVLEDMYAALKENPEVFESIKARLTAA